MKPSLISDLSHAVCELEGMKVLLHVGLERSSAKEKIDLLLGCDDGSIEKYSPLIKSLLKDRWPTENFFVCDDSVRFDLPTGSGGIAICDSNILLRQVAGWVEGKNLGGQHRPWATGYWLPEALCGDLATAKTLHDVMGAGAQLKQMLVPYPVALSKSIVDLCIDEIRQKFSTLEKLHRNAIIERGLCLADVTASMVRMAFARSRRYFRGFRSLEEQVKFLKPFDQSVYTLALEISERQGASDVVNKIKRLL